MIIESFDGQREDEDIIAVWRQHPWVMAKSAMIAVLIVVVGSIPLALSFSWGLWALALFTIAAVFYFLGGYFLWLNTIYILTNQRIFAILQKGILFRSNTEVPLANIQNVSHTQKGVFQMTLKYGNIEIETSGAKTAMILKNVEKPYVVQQKILSKQERE